MSANPGMILGAYTFTRNPERMTSVLEKDLTVAVVKTYSSAHRFSWPASLVGKQVTLEWDYLDTTMYNTLQSMYEADISYTFFPNGGVTNSFTVYIDSLTGTYFLKAAPTTGFRKDVRMALSIFAKLN